MYVYKLPHTALARDSHTIRQAPVMQLKCMLEPLTERVYIYIYMYIYIYIYIYKYTHISPWTHIQSDRLLWCNSKARSMPQWPASKQECKYEYVYMMMQVWCDAAHVTICLYPLNPHLYVYVYTYVYVYVYVYVHVYVYVYVCMKHEFLRCNSKARSMPQWPASKQECKYEYVYIMQVWCDASQRPAIWFSDLQASKNVSMSMWYTYTYLHSASCTHTRDLQASKNVRMSMCIYAGMMRCNSKARSMIQWPACK